MTEPSGSPLGTKGIVAFDLAAATHNLALEVAQRAKYAGPLSTPLSGPQRAAHEARIRRESQERDRRSSLALSLALVDWECTRILLAGNLPALAALGVHQPQRGYEGAVCSECLSNENYEATAAAWPCGTYTAVKGASGG